MANSKKWLRRFAEILVFLALFAGIRAWQQRDVPEGPAPILAGRLLDGKAFERGREPILVHFWATWCPICRTDQASIEALSGSHRVITVALKSGNDAAVAQYMKRQGLHFPVWNDPDGLISDAWGVHAVPASFVLDREGKIRFVEFGYTTGIGLRARLWLAGF